MGVRVQAGRLPDLHADRRRRHHRVHQPQRHRRRPAAGTPRPLPDPPQLTPPRRTVRRRPGPLSRLRPAPARRQLAAAGAVRRTNAAGSRPHWDAGPVPDRGRTRVHLHRPTRGMVRRRARQPLPTRACVAAQQRPAERSLTGRSPPGAPSASGSARHAHPRAVRRGEIGSSSVPDDVVDAASCLRWQNGHRAPTRSPCRRRQKPDGACRDTVELFVILFDGSKPTVLEDRCSTCC